MKANIIIEQELCASGLDHYTKGIWNLVLMCSVFSRGSTGGSRPPSRVRVTFFESEKPLAVSSPESESFDYNRMTLSESPVILNSSTPVFNRQQR